MSTEFGLDLRLARRKSGFTQRDIAQLISSHQSTIASLEKGKWPPTIRQICMLSLIYGRSFESLFSEVLADARAELRQNLPSIPATDVHSALSSNREASLQKLERRLAAKPAQP
jgi:transcriptional regulator with XRE-family HTH domain|tara:strand:+ start:5076 stop:5417 length:342 start_codon:yes stop_codon:yes gene_type:complete